jgi:hypothetical protein
MKLFHTVVVQLAVLILLTSFAMAAPLGTIHGAVTVEGPDGIPVHLPGIDIVLSCGRPARPVSTRTDETGQFYLRDLVPQRCNVTASGEGFHSTTKAVQVVGNSDIEIFFQLRLMTVEEQATMSTNAPTADTLKFQEPRDTKVRALKGGDASENRQDSSCAAIDAFSPRKDVLGF